MPLALMKANYAYAKENELSVHLDVPDYSMPP